MARSNQSGSPDNSTHATGSQTTTRVTRSQTTQLEAAGAAVQHQQLQDPEPVTINWLFFGKSRPPACFIIEIPRRLFNQPSQKCQNLFARELQHRHDFHAVLYTIKFWKVRRHFCSSNVHFLNEFSLKIRFLSTNLMKANGQKHLRTRQTSPR